MNKIKFLPNNNILLNNKTLLTKIKQIREKFPFNEETDCREKYNETIQDYLYEEIISKLWI